MKKMLSKIKTKELPKYLRSYMVAISAWRASTKRIPPDDLVELITRVLTKFFKSMIACKDRHINRKLVDSGGITSLVDYK